MFGLHQRQRPGRIGRRAGRHRGLEVQRHFRRGIAPALLGVGGGVAAVALAHELSRSRPRGRTRSRRHVRLHRDHGHTSTRGRRRRTGTGVARRRSAASRARASAPDRASMFLIFELEAVVLGALLLVERRSSVGRGLHQSTMRAATAARLFSSADLFGSRLLHSGFSLRRGAASDLTSRIEACAFAGMVDQRELRRFRSW